MFNSPSRHTKPESQSSSNKKGVSFNIPLSKASPSIPPQPQSKQPKETSKFMRKSEHHKTVNPSKMQREALDAKLKLLQPQQPSLQAPQTDAQPSLPSSESKFQRKSNRSISLIEKNKLGSSIFKEEMKLKVQINNIVDEATGLPTMKYKVLSKLGEGAYGTVYLAFNLMTKAKVSMKKINKVKENEIDELEIKNEINILKRLDHPNILKILEFYSTPKAYYIITSYCQCGELYDQIKYNYNENQLAVLFYQVFSGLNYLHSQNIVHRDLKLENILITEIEVDNKTGKNYFWIKIIDFGTAKIFEKNKNEQTVVGSSYYIAPEVLQKKYNEKCDTWSAGVILYMLIVGRAPFDGADDDEIIANIKKGTFNSKHKKLLQSSPEVQDLVKKLLEVKVDKRLSAAQALKHPWFKKFNGKSLYQNIEVDKIKMYLNRLLSYEINSKFQQMCLAFITHNLPDSDETKDVLKIFRLFNENDDGKLTKAELHAGLVKYYDAKEIKGKIDDIFLILDGANRGFVEYEEFLRACMSKEKLLSEENLIYAFNFFDKDNTGKISIAKIKNIFVGSKVNEAVFKSIINEVDQNQDGEIDYQEFKDMMFGY